MWRSMMQNLLRAGAALVAPPLQIPRHSDYRAGQTAEASRRGYTVQMLPPEGSTVPDLDIVLTDTPTDVDAAMVEHGLADYDCERVGIRDRRQVAVLARDPTTGQTLGGILGRTSLGMLFVDLVYLPEALRGQ